MEINFNAQAQAPIYEGGFSSIPAGEYPVVITNIVPEKNKEGNTGGHLTVEMTVGPQSQYAGSIIKYYINLFHNNPASVEKSKGQLTALCAVCGKFQGIRDTMELYNIPFIVTTEVNGQWTNVKSVKALDGSQPGKTATGNAPPTNAAPAPPPPPAAATAVWGAPATPATNPIAGWGAPITPAAPATTPAWGAAPAGGPPASTAPAPAWGAQPSGGGNKAPWET